MTNILRTDAVLPTALVRLPPVRMHVMDAADRRAIEDLGADDTDIAEGARYWLERRDRSVVPHIVARLPDLGTQGRLLAIQVFEAIGDPSACPGVLLLLND